MPLHDFRSDWWLQWAISKENGKLLDWPKNSFDEISSSRFRKSSDITSRAGTLSGFKVGEI